MKLIRLLNPVIIIYLHLRVQLLVHKEYIPSSDPSPPLSALAVYLSQPVGLSL